MKTTARQATGHRRKLGRAAVAIMIVGLFACGRRAAAPGEAGSGAPGSAGTGATPTPEPGVMATIGGDPIPYKSFERDLVDNGMDDTRGRDQDDGVKSHPPPPFPGEPPMFRA